MPIHGALAWYSNQSAPLGRLRRIRRVVVGKTFSMHSCLEHHDHNYAIVASSLSRLECPQLRWQAIVSVLGECLNGAACETLLPPSKAALL